MSLRLALALVLLAAPAAYSQQRGATSAQATVERAARVYAKIRTLRATFSQTITNPLTRSTATSRGEILQRVPGELSVRFTEPAGDRIVSDGKALWVYLPSSTPGQVIKTHSDPGGGPAPDIVSWFLNDPTRRYAMADGGAAVVDGHATRVVHLVPRDSTLPFTKATVWVDDDDALLRQVETTDFNGVVRRITILTLVPNAAVDPRAFEFRVPKGVRVVDHM